MTLYQEIIWLKTFFKGKWVVENVKPYYKPLIEPSFTINRHLFWSSDFIFSLQFDNNFTSIRDKSKEMARVYGFDINILRNFSNYDRRKILRNCVVPEIGQYILEQLSKAKGEK